MGYRRYQGYEEGSVIASGFLSFRRKISRVLILNEGVGTSSEEEGRTFRSERGVGERESSTV